jgi:SAM-dependent MidA family methyltransferase
MPVHRLGWDARGKKWFEWGVRWEGQDFGWTRMELRPELAPKNLPPELLEVLPDEFTTEICLAAKNWWQPAARTLKNGKLLTFDYGLSAEQFFTPERKDGTLRAYHQHRQNNELLARPGEQDLTAQVNFSEICAAAEAEGLKTETWTSQGRFLTALVQRLIAEKRTSEEWITTRARQFQTLTHPQHLGRSFQILVQGR